jgi:fatty acid desaturase
MISVKCAGLQLQVPRHQRRPWHFLLRVLFALAIGSAGMALTLSNDWRLASVGLLLEGLFFVHSLELAHSCVHGTAFGSRRLDRLAGTLLALPMLVSYTDYRANHLEHHRSLGVTEKKDFFGYEFDRMTTWQSFGLHLLMLTHYRGAAKNMVQAVLPWKWRALPATKLGTRLDHLLMVVWLLVPLMALAFGHTGPLLVQLAPLLFAVPCHVLVELPEHWQCRQVEDPLGHSRSIAASPIAVWFTNGNNYHFEHHLCPWLSNAALRDVQRQLRGAILHHPSYLEFYSRVASSLRFTEQRE